MSVPSPWIERLNLMPHPEGGFYKEVFRSSFTTAACGDFKGDRSLATCIYYLLPSGAFSAFHRLRSDELWTHADGGSLTVHMIDPDGVYSQAKLGDDIRNDALPFLHIPPNTWFAAEPARHTDSLATCFVAPGFEFQDFEMAKAGHLKSICPQQSELIARLTI